MIRWEVQIKLVSDTTFGRGDGVAGVVDQEVEHDPQTGLPFLRGRTLKGLLVESCADILYSLEKSDAPTFSKFEEAAARLFGVGGSLVSDQGCLHIGKAELSETIRGKIKGANYTPEDVLESLTTIRYQTAVDEITGSPADSSLRAARAVVRGRVFTAPIDIDIADGDGTRDDLLALLGACIRHTRRGGSGRARGRGRLALSILDVDEAAWLTYFAGQLQRGEHDPLPR